MINPKILKYSTEEYIDDEGCLSVPGEKGKVSRYNNIKLQFLDEKGKENIIMLNGLSSRIVQHEIDHLNGILFTDKLV